MEEKKKVLFEKMIRDLKDLTGIGLKEILEEYDYCPLCKTKLKK